MIPAQHQNSHLANRTKMWSSRDSEDVYQKNLRDPQQRQLLASNGWIDNFFTYTYNSHGFRCDEFDPNADAFVALGCSFTEGVGLPQEQTWPAILAQQLGTSYWNLGVGGGSADMCFRLANHYLAWLRPKFVVLLCPTPARLEYYGDSSWCNLQATQVHSYPNDIFLRQWFLNDVNSELNNQKNILAIQALCRNLDIEYYWCSTDSWIAGKDDSVPLTWARDLAHNGVTAHRFFVKKIRSAMSRHQTEIGV